MMMGFGNKLIFLLEIFRKWLVLRLLIFDDKFYNKDKLRYFIELIELVI